MIEMNNINPCFNGKIYILNCQVLRSLGRRERLSDCRCTRTSRYRFLHFISHAQMPRTIIFIITIFLFHEEHYHPLILKIFADFSLWNFGFFYHPLLGIPKDDTIVLYNNLFGKLKKTSPRDSLHQFGLHNITSAAKNSIISLQSSFK